MHVFFNAAVSTWNSARPSEYLQCLSHLASPDQQRTFSKFFSVFGQHIPVEASLLDGWIACLFLSSGWKAGGSQSYAIGVAILPDFGSCQPIFFMQQEKETSSSILQNHRDSECGEW